MSIQERISRPTPPFFRVLRNISIVIAAVTATLATAPVALPAVVVKVAGYLAVAGSVAGAVSQAAVQEE